MNFKIISVSILAAACLAMAQGAGAFGTISFTTNNPNNMSATVREQQNGTKDNRVESLQQQYQKLLKMLEELKEKMASQNATSTIASAADLDCARGYVANREAAIGTAYQTLTGCVSGALTTRKNALDTAWKIAASQDRNQAIGNAWKNFEQARKTCQDSYKEAAKTAWNGFKTKIKTCNVSSAEDNREGADLNLGN